MCQGLYVRLMVHGNGCKLRKTSVLSITYSIQYEIMADSARIERPLGAERVAVTVQIIGHSVVAVQSAVIAVSTVKL